jgi:hypothetical protein
MKEESFLNKICLGLTGDKNIDWQSKLKEINQLQIKEAAVFLERFDKKERDNFYRFFKRSSIESVPLVHLRSDVAKEEIEFFVKRYKTRHFNIHEDHFKLLNNWKGYWDKLYLEMNYDSEIAKNVKVKKIGGFCVDLAHFKTAIARGAEEAYYIFIRKNKIKFACNHISGYSEVKTRDKHIAASLKDFDYLTTLPKYVFGEILAMETDNSIKDQIKFKKYIAKILDKYFRND